MVAFIGTVEDCLGLFYFFGGDNGDETDTHVEGAEHFVVLDVAEVLEVFEEGWNDPRCSVDDGAHSFGDDAGEVLGDPAAGDMGHAGDDFGTGELLDDGEVATVGSHEGGTGLVLELVDVVVGAIAGDFKEELAGEGVAVGMEAIGWYADEDVTDLDVFAGDDFVAVDCADDGSGEVVLAIGVEAWHLGGFSADEGATVGAAGFGESADDGFDDAGVEATGGEVVEEEEGCGSLDCDVVDAVVDEILTDGVVDVEFEGDLELGSYTVG